MFPKSEPLQSPTTSYFQIRKNFNKKNTSYLLKNTFFVVVTIINLLIEMYAQKFFLNITELIFL